MLSTKEAEINFIMVLLHTSPKVDLPVAGAGYAFKAIGLDFVLSVLYLQECIYDYKEEVAII